MADTIASNLVVLTHLAHQINNREFLYNLCLVSKGFHAIFVKQLYKCIRLDGQSATLFLDRFRRKFIIQSSWLRYTKILLISSSVDVAFSVSDNSAEEANETIEQDDGEEFEGYEEIDTKYLRLNRCVLDLIRNCPNLHGYASAFFPLDHNCMKALANLSNLDSISIESPEYDAQDSGIETNVPEDIDQTILSSQSEPHEPIFGHTIFGQSIYLPRFKNLHKLSLLSMNGDAGIWRTGILKILLQSPQLHHLSLSTGGAPPDSEGDDDSGMEPWFSLFEWVCQQYHAILGKPVSLKTIRLGYNLRLPDPVKLHGAMETRYLETLSLSIANQPSLFRHNLGQWELLWRILSPSITPNLKYLACGYVKDQDKLRSLINERAGLSSLAFHNCWKIGFQLGEQGRPSDFLLDPHSYEKLAYLSFTLWLRYAEYPALEHLKNCNWITHISIYLLNSRKPKVANTLPLIHQMVANLPNIQALWVDQNGSGVFSRRSFKALEDAREAAWQLFNASTTLRYLRLGKTAWRAHRNASVLVLEELDEWEDQVEGPEIFHVPRPLSWSFEMDHFDL